MQRHSYTSTHTRCCIHIAKSDATRRCSPRDKSSTDTLTLCPVHTNKTCHLPALANRNSALGWRSSLYCSWGHSEQSGDLYKKAVAQFRCDHRHAVSGPSKCYSWDVLKNPEAGWEKNKVTLFCKHSSDWNHVHRLIVHHTKNSDDLPLLMIVFYFIPFSFANVMVWFIFPYAITGFEYVPNTEPQL